MKKFWLWQYMLNKRLLHKKEFIILLCLIPVLVWCVTTFAKEDSGVVTVLLAMEDKNDELACNIIDEMKQEESIIRYVEVDVDRVYEKIEAGEADCAWIFRENLQDKLITTFAGKMEKEVPVYVVTQEDNVALQLARTKLYGYIFPHLAFLLCENYLETEILGGQQISIEELEEYYVQSAVEGSLIQVVQLSPDDMKQMSQKQEDKNSSYLVAPLRGILMVLIIVTGLVVTMFYLQDQERGTFSWVPLHKRRRLLYSYLFPALFDTGLVVIISLFISEGGSLTSREVLVFLLYLPVVAVFCELMKIICRKKENLAKCIPLLSIAMLALCPVFLDMGRGFVPQYLFPPTYYLRVKNDLGQVWWMLVYSLVFFVIGTIYHKLSETRAR